MYLTNKQRGRKKKTGKEKKKRRCAGILTPLPNFLLHIFADAQYSRPPKKKTGKRKKKTYQGDTK